MAVRLVDGKTFQSETSHNTSARVTQEHSFTDSLYLLYCAFISVPGDVQVVSKKKQLVSSHASVSSLPSSYQSNTLREETVIQYAEHFRRQFIQFYPHRRALLLCPQNECGIRKFVCTSIHPTLLPFSQEYELSACVQLVADLCEYLPLDDPLTLPDYLPASTSVLSVRAGDCLDLSTLLCSLLCGSGYNAYVVSGCAPRWICANDVSAVPCPLLRDEQAEQRKAQEEAEKYLEEEKKRNRYLSLVPPVPSHTSSFLTQRENERNQAEQQREKERQQKQRESAQAAIRDPLHPRRAHAWVMVLKGRREIQEDVFIEPSSGFIYPIHSKSNPYLSVDSAWNQHNYWVNVQRSTNGSSPSFPLEHLRVDLSNTEDWLYVVEKTDGQKNKTEAGRGEETRERSVSDYDNEEKPGEEEKHQLSHSHAARTSSKQRSKQVLSLPVSWMSPIRISRDMWQSRYPRGIKIIQYDHCTVEKHSPYDKSVHGLIQKITVFASNSVFPTTNATSTVTSTPPPIIEIHETFAHRKDKLHERVSYPQQRRIHWRFEAGLPHGLAEYIEVAGMSREYMFRSGSRVDGLVRRHEKIGVKVIEEYEKRDDRLIYRSITIDPTAQINTNTTNTSTSTTSSATTTTIGSTSTSMSQPSYNRQKAFCIAIGNQVEFPIHKLTEKYARHPSLHAELDVIKRTHLLSDNLIRLDYAAPVDGLQGSYIVIDKNDKLDSGEVEGIAANSRYECIRRTADWMEVSRAEQQQQVMKLLIIEKELKVKVKEREARMSALLQELHNLEQHVVLIENVYDAAYHHAVAQVQQHQQQQQHQQHSSETVDGNDVSSVGDDVSNENGSSSTTSSMSLGMGINVGGTRIDYLTPFLPTFTGNTSLMQQPLTKKQCEQIKAACLTALKERLLARAQIIQAHLEDEQSKLHSKQSAFKRQAGSGSMEANEEFQAFSAACLFRIDILLARRARHEQLALKKYQEMDQQLDNDPRLVALHLPD